MPRALPRSMLESGEAEVTTVERPLRLHLLRMIPTIVVVGLLIHFLLPRLGTFEASLETLHSLAPWAIALAALAEAASYLANGAVLRSVICLAGEKMPLRRAVAIELGAGSVSLVAAGALGFGAAIYRWTRNGGISRETAMLASWLPSMFDSVTLVFFALAGALELLHEHSLTRPTFIALVVVISGLALAVAGLIVLLARGEWMMRVADLAARLLRRIFRKRDFAFLSDAAERAVHTWQSMHRGGWIPPMLYSLAVLAFDLLCLDFAFIAAGHHVKLPLLLAGYGVPLLLGRASFLPGGIAVVEVGMAALFGGLGVPANVAVIGVLTYRLISFWIPAIVGVPIAVSFQARRR